MGKQKKIVPHSVKQKHPRNKRNKANLVFDEKARMEYLTGFRKRKQERKKIAQEKIIEDLKEEKRKLKQKKREELNEKWRNLDLQSNLDSFSTGTTYDLPNHTVTVSDVSINFVGGTGYHLGQNEVAECEETSRSQKQDDSDQEESQQNSNSKEEQAKGGKKKKKKFHKNLTHLMSKQSLAKKNKTMKRLKAQAGPVERKKYNNMKKKHKRNKK